MRSGKLLPSEDSNTPWGCRECLASFHYGSCHSLMRPRCPRGEHQPNGVVPVHLFTCVPLRCTGLAADACLCVLSIHPGERLFKSGTFRRRKLVQLPCSSVHEVDLAVLAPLAVEATFMNQMMMMSTEQHQVVQTGFTTVCPVNDVVPVDELVIGATRETATAVSCLQCPPHRWWNRA